MMRVWNNLHQVCTKERLQYYDLAKPSNNMSDTATQFIMLMNYFFYLFSTNEEYVTSIISNSGIEGKEEVDMNVRDFGYSVYSLWSNS
jgi:hypothetical protein